MIECMKKFELQIIQDHVIKGVLRMVQTFGGSREGGPNCSAYLSHFLFFLIR